MKTLQGVFLLVCLLTCSRVIAQEPQTRETSSVSHVEWARSTNHILITQREGGLFLVDAITQSIAVELPGSLTGPIEDAALQPGGSRVATVDRFSGLKIWDMNTRTLIYSDDLVLAWQVDWSPNNERLITGNANEIFIRNATGETLFQVSYAAEDAPAIAFSSDSKRLALSFSPALQIFDLSTQQSISFNILPGLRQSIQWNKDGTALLAANVSNRREGTFYNILVINPLTGERIREYSGFPNQLTSARWSPDETEILATSVDGTAYLVDADSGEITPIFTGDVPLLSADWSPYGGQVAIGAPVHSQTGQSLSETGATIAGVPVHILIPAPSLDRLNTIAEMCVRDAPTPSRTVTGLASQPVASLDALPDFIAQVEALPADAIPAACRADLLVVAGALR